MTGKNVRGVQLKNRAPIKFKIASLTYKTLSTCQPAYLRDLIMRLAASLTSDGRCLSEY